MSYSKEFDFEPNQARIGIMDAIETQSLEQHENVIDAWVKEKDAVMIYWHHFLKVWDYLLACDEEIINGEMIKLANLIRIGMIVNVRMGLVVDVKGTQLYPVEFEFKDMLCPAYFVVAKRGLIDHLHMTPYFFRSEDKRHEFYDFITEHS